MSANCMQMLDQRKKDGNLRELTLRRHMIDFCSNDYLGIGASRITEQTFLEEWHKHSHLYKLGSTGSRLLSGNSQYAENLEQFIADFHGYPSGLLFGSGYLANEGLFTTLSSESNVIFFDQEVHASTRNGIKLSRAASFAFRHNDLNHLESRLKSFVHKKHLFIAIESIYSTSGDEAPIEEICAIANKYKASLIVDEAHSVGIRGPMGKGLVSEKKLTQHLFAHIVTFGKALAAQGGMILGSKFLKKALLNKASSCIYTTAMPFTQLAAIKSSYLHFPSMESQRYKLNGLISYFSKATNRLCNTPIQHFAMKGNAHAKSVESFLSQNGFDVRALLSPTVAKGKERLRVILHSHNTKEQILDLLKMIQSQGVSFIA